jgi:hypothetical protein
MATPLTPHDLDPNVHISLTDDLLDLTSAAALVSSPEAGAVCSPLRRYLRPISLHSLPLQSDPTHTCHRLGTTRNSFKGHAVATLSYSAYRAKCEQTMKTIARDTKERFALTAIAITHRLGDVGVGEDSVHVAASSPHRRAAFEAATFALEAVKHLR